MSTDELTRIAAQIEAGESLAPADARSLLDEVYRLRKELAAKPPAVIRPIAPEGTDPSQAWFWTPRWQQMEREADDDIATRRVRTFEDADALLAYLERER